MMPITQSKSVLLVEDDELVRECLCEMLSDAGLQVAGAANAAEALDRMNADGMPGVLVTDMMLGSGMSGPALIVAARLRWLELRAVLMSGNDTAELATHPGDQFLGKPFNIASLIQAVTGPGVEPALSNCRRVAFGA